MDANERRGIRSLISGGVGQLSDDQLEALRNACDDEMADRAKKKSRAKEDERLRGIVIELENTEQPTGWLRGETAVGRLELMAKNILRGQDPGRFLIGTGPQASAITTRELGAMGRLDRDSRDWVPMRRVQQLTRLAQAGLVEIDVRAGLAHITERGQQVLAGRFLNRQHGPVFMDDVERGLEQLRSE